MGRTELKTPFLARDGGFDMGRYLGCQDLVAEFDGRWGDALMEMLVDPVLVEWVPRHVREQYERWNPFFRRCLDSALEEAVAAEQEAQEAGSVLPRRFRNNAKLLAHVRRKMVKLHEKYIVEQAEDFDKDGLQPDEGAPSDDESKDSDDDPELAAARAQDEDVGAAVDLEHDELPSFGQADGPDGDFEIGEWAEMSIEAKVSAAGPARAPDVALGGVFSPISKTCNRKRELLLDVSLVCRFGADAGRRRDLSGGAHSTNTSSAACCCCSISHRVGALYDKSHIAVRFGGCPVGVSGTPRS